MTRPLSADERDEVENLAAECERPERLHALLAELIRARSVLAFVRQHRHRLPPQTQRIMAESLPERTTSQVWLEIARETEQARAEREASALGSPRLI